MDTPNFHLQSHTDALYVNQSRQLAFRARTVEDFNVWQATLREKILQLLGLAGRALPAHVKAQLLQSTDCGDYVEERYALDVGEGVFAPVYLLIPKTPPPYQPVLVFHGHDPSPLYFLGHYPDEATAQHELAHDNNYAQALAQTGYLVCAVIQRGFGERMSDQIHPSYGNSCRHLSFEYQLQGRTMVGERCWDGMVALTFLLNREDVVKRSVGCTGQSGGGTTALWLSALDKRITISVPSGYFCSFKRSILSMEHCECNYVPHILEYAEMGDLAALIAPRPLRFVNGERDPIFPIQGTREQFETVKNAYALLGASDRCSLAVHPGEHQYHHALSHEWFNQWLKPT